MPEFSVNELKDIQGLILSGYAHLRYGAYLFLHIKDQAKAAAWLKKIIPMITTSERWEALPGGGKKKPDVTTNLAFTYPGLKALGLPEETLFSFTREFIWGMAQRSHNLGDCGESAPEKWELGGPNTEEVHVLVYLNAIDEATLDTLRETHRALIKESAGGVIEINEQHGHRPPNDKEHFGFHDGIAQPKIQRMPGYPDDVRNVVATGEFILGYPTEFPGGMKPPSPWTLPEHDPENVLRPFEPEDKDVYGKKNFGFHGTYLVYRKLAQDVAGFWNYLADKARRGADGSPEAQDIIYLASKCVGRWPSGAPLALSPEKDDPELGHDADRNDRFLYFERDRDGHACPIGSHIRRCNPRDSRYLEEDKQFALESSDKHRIIRRAVSFGPELFPRDAVEQGKIPANLKDDGQERGLHFFGLNASLRSQFEFLQQTWCNNDVFDGLYANKDPLIGDNEGKGTMVIPRKPVRRLLSNLPRFVTTRGGAYFFVPSMTALRYLAGRG